MGRRLKCGEVFLWNNDALTCAIECTLCEDRPTCKLKDFIEHLQAWHQEGDDDDDDDDNDDVDVDFDDEEKFENDLGQERSSEAETETERECEGNVDDDDDYDERSKQLTQPFEEVLIEVDASDENEFEFSEEEICCGKSDVDVVDDLKFLKKNKQPAVMNAGAHNKIHLTIDDIAFKELKIQCSEIDTTQTTFENDFRQWCLRQQQQQQQHSREIDCMSQTRSSEDSGFDKSDTISIAASDESDNFQINEENIKEQILFGLNQTPSKPKLTTSDIEKLIELYQQHARLWQQSHPEYNDAPKCRESWQEIKQNWNKLCQRDFDETDIRIRLSTLRQRYLKERERHEKHKENDHFNARAVVQPFPQRFRYYEKLSFLDEQNKQLQPFTLQKTRISQEHSQLIEIYKHFPLLWQKNHSLHKNHEERQRAYECICTALELIGIHLSKQTVRLRLSMLKERYRNQKIQHLQCRLRGRTFVPEFKHYEEMKFLDKHIAPYHCDNCGSIFRLFDEYNKHAEEEREKQAYVDKSENSVEDLEPETVPTAAAVALTTTANEAELEKVLSQELATGNAAIKTTVTEAELPNVCDELVKLISEDGNLEDEHALKTQESDKKYADEPDNSNEALLANSVAGDIIIDNVQQEDFNKALEVENLSDQPQNSNLTSTELMSYANEQNILMPLQWTNESLNNIPIFYMDPEAFLSEFNASNSIEPNNEAQHFLVLNNEDAFLESPQVVFVGTENIALQPLVTATQADEINDQSNAVVNENDYEHDMAKVYTNLVNTLNEETNAATDALKYAGNLTNEVHFYFDGEATSFEEIESSQKFDESVETTQVQNVKEIPAELTLAITEALGYEANEQRAEIHENVAIAKPTLAQKANSKLENDLLVENSVGAAQNLVKKTPIEITDVQIIKPLDAEHQTRNISKQQTVENIGVQTRSSKALMASVTSENFQADIPLSSCVPATAVRKRMPYTLTRLTEAQTVKLIELYRLTPQLWNPAHAKFDSRRHKRLSWRQLALQFNASFYLNYNWLQVQRKMMDYVKYYKREQKRTKTKPHSPKWPFYDSLKFLDEVDVNTTNLEKRMQLRKDTIKIIEIYKQHPQLWDTTHAQYRKRNQRKFTIAAMCSRLQEVHNVTIEPKKLKQCLLELRFNFRATKLARIEAEKRNEPFEAAARFEFYDELKFLESHQPPFNCEKCKMKFQCLSEFNKHNKKEHKKSQKTQVPLMANDIDNCTVDNVCHICGIKFTLRQNLVQHLKRHFKERQLSCSHCDKKFFTNGALDEHQRTHTRIPAVICPECGRTFFNTSKLTQHLKRHRNQRDFPCDQCGKAFYSAFERERHIRRHLNIRDKICPICGKSFVVGSSYYAHIKLHSSKKEYTCDVCQKEFAQYSGLYKHRRRYHPT